MARLKEVFNIAVMRHADILSSELSKTPREVTRQLERALKNLKGKFKGELAIVTLFTDEHSLHSAKFLNDTWNKAVTQHIWESQDLRSVDSLLEATRAITYDSWPVLLIVNEAYAKAVLKLAGLTAERTHYAVPIYLQLLVSGRQRQFQLA